MVLSGCATTARYEALLNTWVGDNEDSLVSSWGPPQNIYQMRNGKKLIEYSQGRNVQMGGYSYTTPQTTYQQGVVGNTMYSGTSTQYVTQTTPVYNINLWCKTCFTISSNGIIESWRWEGNNCKSNYKPPKVTPVKGIPWQSAVIKSGVEDNSIDRKERDAREHFDKGVAYLDAKNTGKAIFEFNKAAELDQDDTMTHLFLGVAFMDQKNYDNAILEFNQVTKLDPNELRAYLERGSAYVFSDDYDQAILECNKAITINPNFAEAYDLRGIIYEKQKKYVESLEDTERAKKLGFNEDEKRIEDLRNKIKQKQ